MQDSAGDKLNSRFYPLRRNTAGFHVKMIDGQLNEIIMETLRDYLHYHIYNFRKNCDPLMRIKRRIEYIIFLEFCPTTDEQLLGT